MKITALVLGLLLASSAFADDHGKMKGEKFEDRKAKVLEKINKRLEAMQGHKKCVEAAKDKDAMKACRAKMQDTRSEWKEMRKDKRKGRKDK